MSKSESRASVGAACTLLLVALAVPQARDALEASLATHMLVQLPLLAVVGAGIGYASEPVLRPMLSIWNRAGATGLLLAIVIAMVWMLPRAMDAALVDMRVEAAKFASLPLAGAALAWSYPQAGPIVKGLLHAHVVSALGVMGWAYLAAPVRLCNGYLASDQQAAGTGLLLVAIGLSVYFAVRLICGPIRANPPSRPSRTLELRVRAE